MSKRLVGMVVGVVVLFVFQVSAIDISGGVKGGLALGTLSGKGIDNMDSGSTVGMRKAFAGYGFLSLDFSENLGAQFEIGYVGKGKHFADPDNSKNTIQINANYLEIPILLKGMLPLGAVKPFLFVGPTIGFNLGTSMDLHLEEGGQTLDTTLTVDDSTVNTVEFGLAFGGGTTFDVGPGAIVIDVRYTIGLTSISKLTESAKAAGVKEEDIETKTGTLALMVGYQFKF